MYSDSPFNTIGAQTDSTGVIQSYIVTLNNHQQQYFPDYVYDPAIVISSYPESESVQKLTLPDMTEIGDITTLTPLIAKMQLTLVSDTLQILIPIQDGIFMSNGYSEQIYNKKYIYTLSYLKGKQRNSVFAFQIQVSMILPILPLPSPYVNKELFPIIYDLEQLKNSGFYEYIDNIYGVETIQEHYPIDISKFFYFYEKILPYTVKNTIVPLVKDTPSNFGDFFRLGFFGNSVPDTIWAYIYTSGNFPPATDTTNDYIVQAAYIEHPTPPFEYSSGFRDNQWVEVNHCCCDPPGTGYWFYFTRGSGIWYNLGRTIVFPDHIDAYCYFTKTTKCEFTSYDTANLILNQTLNKTIYSLAKAQGFDSIQYNYRYEAKIFKYEVTDLRVSAEKQNPDGCFPVELSDYIRAGWWRTDLEGMPPLPCVCVDTPSHCLNCQNQKIS